MLQKGTGDGIGEREEGREEVQEPRDSDCVVFIISVCELHVHTDCILFACSDCRQCHQDGHQDHVSVSLSAAESAHAFPLQK